MVTNMSTTSLKHDADKDDAIVTRGSGNVFADLGLPNAEEEMVKARLVVAIRDGIEAKGLSQTAAARLMGLRQPDVSKLLKGHVGGFSLDRLLKCVRALGRDVDINIKPAKAEHEGRLRLLVA